MDLLFPSSEDEVIGVEHLMAEPPCTDIVDGILGFETFNPEKGFRIEGFSSMVHNHTKIVFDAAQQGHQGSEPKDEVCYFFLDGNDHQQCAGTNNLSDTCEDYLLDTKYDEDLFNLLSVPSKEFSTVDLDFACPPSGETECGNLKSELTAADTTTLGAQSDQNSSFLDMMTTGELHDAFKNMFGRETAVQDKQWLKHRISFGLENLVELENSLILPECCTISNENDSKIVLPTNAEKPLETSNGFSGIFNFKRKPRFRQVKRQKFANCHPLKSSSTNLSEIVSDHYYSGEKESTIARKRLRKPTQRYIEELLEQRLSSQKKQFGNSRLCSKGPPSDSDRHLSPKGSGAKPLACSKQTFKGDCIQVPFGLPIQGVCSKKKGHLSEDCKGNELLDPDVGSDGEPYSPESHDDVSDEDCITRTKTQKCKSRRKHHMLWSLPEVLKLVDGVSEYGVGRWTEIKRLLFPSSSRRTSVDLKDKWRNLLKASRPRSHNKRRINPRKPASAHSIPQHVMRRVRELALMYPYPRERQSRETRTVTAGSPIVPSHDNLVCLSAAVRV